MSGEKAVSPYRLHRAVNKGLQVFSEYNITHPYLYNHWFVCSLDEDVLTISGYAVRDKLYSGTLASITLEKGNVDEVASVLYALVACCADIVTKIDIAALTRDDWGCLSNATKERRLLFPSIATHGSGTTEETAHTTDIDGSPHVGAYMGQTDQGRVLVRVSKNYNVVPHQLLARATPQAAPAIYSCEPLYPGSEYRVIVMEDLTYQTVPLVMGDVREPNVMVRVVRPKWVSSIDPTLVNGRVHVQLVDYELCRTCQERWYDTSYNLELDWPPELVAAAMHRDTALFPLMSPRHDAHMLEAMRHRVVQVVWGRAHTGGDVPTSSD
ncbi:hypothetical protein KIPB_002634 [Kipferlia bialata]|uniref:Uncharacterized protein n=1 Tax=Kipferlia bialata TaxID=797122 RepID=A0A9K3GGE8_9EUKA|nr:hypothetical protein KIPB_002634 [Kipferlia bialata]|eukprot:g2634.t1